MLTWKEIPESRTLRDQDTTRVARAAHLQVTNMSVYRTIAGQLFQYAFKALAIGGQFRRDSKSAKNHLFAININTARLTPI